MGQANHLRREVVATLGKRDAGRDIVRRGVLERNGKTRRPTRAELIRYVDVLAGLLVPPARGSSTTSVSSLAPAGSGSSSSSVQTPTAQDPPQAVSASSGSSSGGSSSGNLPACTWVPESGGDWQAVNPSSGAGGRYQITPSTWAANGGSGLPQDASPAEQTRVAENVMRSQGLGAWTNC